MFTYWLEIIHLSPVKLLHSQRKFLATEYLTFYAFFHFFSLLNKSTSENISKLKKEKSYLNFSFITTKLSSMVKRSWEWKNCLCLMSQENKY